MEVFHITDTFRLKDRNILHNHILHEMFCFMYSMSCDMQILLHPHIALMYIT